MMDEIKRMNWIDAFRDWFGIYTEVLNRRGITVEIPDETRGNGIYADLKSERYEVTVQLWDNGLSDFHVLDWKAADMDPDYQVKVTHHEFQNEGELFSALDGLVTRMREDDKTPIVVGNWPISGYSEIEYPAPSSGEPFSVPTGKGKFK